MQEQQGRIARLQAEVSLLETALADSQKQAMSLGARLALSDTKNEELLNQIEVFIVSWRLDQPSRFVASMSLMTV